MIKVKALKIFEDLYTGKVYRVGDILEISRERYEEIEKNLEAYGGNFLQLVEEPTEDGEKEETTEKKNNKRGSKKVIPDETTED